MADTSIDKLSIDIDYSANTANAGLAKLKSALQELNTIVTPATQNLGAISRKLNSFGKATQQLNSANLLRFSTGLKAISNSVAPLTQLGKTNLGSFINQLKKIPDLNKTLDEKSIAEFTVKIQKLSNAMIPLATNLTKVGSVLSSMPSKLNKISSQSSKVNGTVSALSGLSKALNFGAMIALGRRAGQFLGEFITQSNKYVEDLNLFNVAMGESTEKAKEFIDTVSDKLGLDPANMMRYMGVFQMIANGFGLGADNAYKMSKNLTQLTYDISSFYNIDIDEAAQKVQSAISGELEPVRRLGYALDQATLKQIALNNGIEKSFTDMTQAEKAQLRYIALLTQNVQVQGDMGRTIMSSANAIRVLKQQFQLLGREIGNIFIPALMKIIPVAIAVVRVLSKVAKAIASMLGFQLPDLNWDSVNAGAGAVEDLEEDLDDATGAAKKLKRQLAGFDELNNLTSPTQGGGGGTNTDLGAGFELDLPEYDMLAGYTKGIDDMTNKIMKMFGLSENALGKLSWKWEDVDSKIKAVIITLGGLFALKGITKFVGAISTIGTAFKTVKSLAKGFFKIFTGSTVAKSTSSLGGLSGGFEKIASALGMTSTTLLGLIAGIGVAVGIFIKAYKEDEKFRTSVKNLGTAFKKLLSQIKPVIDVIGNQLIGQLKSTWEHIKFLVGTFEELVKFNFSTVITGVTGYLEILTKLLQGDIGGAAKSFVDTWVQQGENAKNTFMNIGNKAAEMVYRLQRISLEAQGIKFFGEDTLSAEELEAISNRIASSVYNMKGAYDEFDSALKSNAESFKEIYNETDILIEKYTLLGDHIDGDASKKIVDALTNTTTSAKTLISTTTDDVTNLLMQQFKNSDTITEDEQKAILENLINGGKSRTDKLDEIEKHIKQVYDNAIKARGKLNETELQDIREHYQKIADLTSSEMKMSGVELNRIVKDITLDTKNLTEESLYNYVNQVKTSYDKATKDVEDNYQAQFEAAKKTGQLIYDNAIANGKSQKEAQKEYNDTVTKLQADADAQRKSQYQELKKTMAEIDDKVLAKVKESYRELSRTNESELTETQKVQKKALQDVLIAAGQNMDDLKQKLGRGGGGAAIEFSKEFNNNLKMDTPLIPDISNQAYNLGAKIGRNISAGFNQYTDLSIRLAAGGYTSGGYYQPFASGGFPSTGQFFMARENGPELVGQIGNRTAVANNDQIVAGIQQGVYNAMVEAQGSNSGSQNIYIGNRKVYSSFSSGLRTENNRLGKAVVSV